VSVWTVQVLLGVHWWCAPGVESQISVDGCWFQLVVGFVSLGSGAGTDEASEGWSRGCDMIRGGCCRCGDKELRC